MVPNLTAPGLWWTLNSVTWWVFLLFVVAAAGAASFGLAHAIIPSLQSTRQAPRYAVSLRPALYGLAVVFWVLEIFLLAGLILPNFYATVFPFWPRVWI